MARHFSDWLTDYAEYAKDDFCPDKFHFWTGISVIATALERKVWSVIDNVTFYPNLYVLLIGRPGVGKSKATSLGVGLLRKLDDINFVAAHNSEASLVKQAARWKKFYVGTREYTQAAAFLYASEASNTIKELAGGGEIKACLTDFYDCHDIWKKELVKEAIVINNGCFNVLACSTFAFLKQLVPKKEADGGFASRFIYVAQREYFARKPKWHRVEKSYDFLGKLLDDLRDIHAMSGQFSPTDDLISAFENWFPQQDLERQLMPSERLQGFLTRRHTNIVKLAMIVSASESSSGKLTLAHWQRATQLFNELELDIPFIVDQSVDKDSEQSISYHIMKTIEDLGGECGKSELLATLLRKGVPTSKIEIQLNGLQRAKLIEVNVADGGRCKLLANPKDYL